MVRSRAQQLGVESHFARLRLLDPDRYRDLATFQAEAKDYKGTAEIAEKLLAEKELSTRDISMLRRLLAHDAQLEHRLAEVNKGDKAARQALLGDLLDLHGPGRVLFRNARSGMMGFPKRTAHLAKLAAGQEAEHWLDRVSTEFFSCSCGSGEIRRASLFG
jgi:ATP-dependent helicase HepA